MFSIIIPVYNEEELIKEKSEKLIRHLGSLNDKYEIIIVDNGSTDKTKEIGENLKGVNFLSTKKRGVGLAFKKAVKQAKYENIISLDMDLSTNLDFIKRSLDLLKEYDLVIGSKKIGKQKRSFLRKFISDIFIFLTKKLLNLSYRDYSIGAKAYKKNIILDHINRIDHGTSYVIDLICFAKLDGKKIIEIPVECFDTRKSRFNLFNEIVYRFKNLIRLWIELKLNKKPKI